MKFHKIWCLLFIFSCSHVGPKKVSLSSGEREKDHRAFSKDIMIVTQGKRSSQIGMEIYNQGGNIYDIAIAVSFALAVERPQSTGIGGGGFFLHHQKGFKSPLAIDFREKAPLKANQNMFLNSSGDEIKNLSREGILSVGVPGMVAGLVEIHRKFGRLSFEQLIRPSIILAEKGFKIYPELAFALQLKEELLRKYATEISPFFKKNGRILGVGDILIQKDLAKTLRSIAEYGRDGFYKGIVAQNILETSSKYHGILTQKDLNKYQVVYRNSIEGSYRGFKVYSMPLPSSGGILLVEILNILEGYNLKDFGIQSPKTIHLMNTAFGKAFEDRSKYLGDSDFENVSFKKLLSKSYAKSFREKVNEEKAYDFNSQMQSEESPNTTHFSIMDSNGNSISSTQTINGYFGSGILVNNSGFFLNNEMDDFAVKVGSSNLFGALGGKNNLIKRGKRPLSSMSPTMIFKDDAPVLVLGSPAGTKIITCVAQTILNYLEHGLPLYDSVALVRTHYQVSPNYIYVEERGLPSKTVEGLKKMGHQIEERDLGCRIQAIALEKELQGVSDPRGFGLSLGI